MSLEDSSPIDILKSDLARTNFEINAIHGRIADYKYQLHLLEIKRTNLEEQIRTYGKES